MGTRSITAVMDNGYKTKGGVYKVGKELVTIYRQFDGYPSGMGQDILNFILYNNNGEKDKIELTGGGIPYNSEGKRLANGMRCFAAQLIGYLKGDSVGNIYIFPPGSRDCGEEYIYTIYPNPDNENELMMRIEAGATTMFGMPGTKQKNMNTIYNGLISEFNAEEVENIQNNMEAPPNDFLDEIRKNKEKKSIKKEVKKSVKKIIKGNGTVSGSKK